MLNAITKFFGNAVKTIIFVSLFAICAAVAGIIGAETVAAQYREIVDKTTQENVRLLEASKKHEAEVARLQFEKKRFHLRAIRMEAEAKRLQEELEGTIGYKIGKATDVVTGTAGEIANNVGGFFKGLF